MTIRIIVSLSLSLVIVRFCQADVGNRGPWGDQGDGTYKNPILPGDFSDPDVIRVGNDYYFITSTFQYSPGMAVMHSKDLVNWQYISHCVDDLRQIGPELNWDRMNRYNRGIYAGAIRYHEGKFWVYFTTMDEGVFMTTAENPAGPWEPLTRVWDAQGWDDPTPFWDDDGQAYLVMSNPGGKNAFPWCPHLFKMSADGKTIDPASAVILDPLRSSEGNKLYKIDGTYYFFHNEYHQDRNVRVGVMQRSRKITGPWEKKVVLEDWPSRYDRQPNQGGLVQTPTGDWWFITQQGRGETGTYDGRPSHLLPVQWVDGWPIPGTVDANGAGTITWHAKKPIAGFPPQTPQTSDSFDSLALAPQWEWNYQPRADHWSLSERPGWLRLHSFKPILAGNFEKAGNTLTQRVMGTNGGEIIAKADVSRMADGQVAGLALFWKEIAKIGVTQKDGTRRIEWTHDNQRKEGPEITGTEVWLKSSLNGDGTAHFSYSLDGRTFVEMGGTFTMGWHNYRGTRIALYSYNNLADAGWVDFDSFDYHITRPREKD